MGNTENKRRPRGGRARYTGEIHTYTNGKVEQSKEAQRYKRAAEKEEEEDPVITEVADFSKSYWVDLFDGFAGMTDPVSSDLALFLYCIQLGLLVGAQQLKMTHADKIDTNLILTR